MNLLNYIISETIVLVVVEVVVDIKIKTVIVVVVIVVVLVVVVIVVAVIVVVLTVAVGSSFKGPYLKFKASRPELAEDVLGIVLLLDSLHLLMTILTE